MERITLKNIKHSIFASEETHCYQATVWFDGKPVGQVSNDGRGGPDREIIRNPKSWETMTHYIKTLPSREFMDRAFSPDLETICGDLVNQWLARKELKRLLKSRVIVRKPGGELIQTKANISPVVLKKWGEQYMAENAANVVLNTLNFDTALKLFMGDK